MSEPTIQRINETSFVVSLASIVSGVIIGILGVWGLISPEDGTLWKALGTVGIVFVGSVLTNLAIGCYSRRGEC